MFREMRRHRQQLDPAKCHEVLAKAPRGVLSVIGDDGWPYGITVNFVFDPDDGAQGALYLHAAREGHKLDAIAACDKVSFTCIDEGYQNEGEWWWYFNSVVCFCRASLVEDPQRKHDALFALARKYFPPSYDIEDDIARSGSRVNMIRLEVVHMTGKLVQEK